VIESLSDLTSGLNAPCTKTEDEIGRTMDDVIRQIQAIKETSRQQLEDRMCGYEKSLTDLLNQLMLPETVIDALNMSTSQIQESKQTCSTESLLEAMLILENVQGNGGQVGSIQISAEPGEHVKFDTLGEHKALERLIQVEDTGDILCLGEETQTSIDIL